LARAICHQRDECAAYVIYSAKRRIGFRVDLRYLHALVDEDPRTQYSVNGERRSFALLRPAADAASQERVRDLILEAYAETEAATVAATA
jgi:hypothetical protein